jgi:hypothetical protein
MKVTIFGSCRQHAIYKFCDVTPIQEHLTYTHNTREMIQAIEFCKGAFASPLPTSICFRSGILARAPPNPAPFQAAFLETDLFVLEVATRKVYTYRDTCVHHILSEEKYGFYDWQKIVSRDLTDEEIEADLVSIVKRLAPKPLLVVSHVYTKQEGKRYELVKLLRHLTTKYMIPFLDPMEELQGEDPMQLFEKEQVISHYTPYGHTQIEKVYRHRLLH